MNARTPGALQLIVMRHGHAVDQRPGGRDFDRELSPTGEREAAAAGRRLAALQLSPDLVLVSPAARTRRTAEIALAQLPAAQPAVQFEPRMYNASVPDLLNLLREVPPHTGALMLVGHNPGSSELGQELAGTAPLAPLPTAGFYVLKFAVDWKAVSHSSVEGAVEEFHQPGLE